MIRYLDDKEKPVCRELWEEAFPEDSKEFDDYYFKEKLKDNRILALLEEDGEKNGDGRSEKSWSANCSQSVKVDAMIHLNPYSLIVRGRCWQVDYLVGVATRKEKRHRGYMRRLLMRMMADMRREQMPFCFLMPADEAIYKPFGFTYIYRQMEFVRGMGWQWEAGQQEIMLEAAELGVRKDQNESEEQRVQQSIPMIPRGDSDEYQSRLAEAAQWMNQWLGRHYQVYAKRDEAYLKRLVDELASEEGTLDILYCDDEIAAMESWWGRDKKEQRLLYGEEPYVEAVCGSGKPAIMARIISPETFVSVIHLRENEERMDSCVIPLYIRDSLIGENEGLWMWKLNRETSCLERSDSSGEGEQGGWESKQCLPKLSLTIDELTAWLFGYQVPEAAKPYEAMVETLRDVFLDEVV